MAWCCWLSFFYGIIWGRASKKISDSSWRTATSHGSRTTTHGGKRHPRFTFSEIPGCLTQSTKSPNYILGPGNYYKNLACAHMRYEISQNNIHYFEIIGDTWYILLSSALLILRWN
jgi:hypothetical protein